MAALPAAGLSLATSLDAQANGRSPAAHQLVVSPTDPSFFVIEATFGLLVSHDTGASFGWVCENAVGYGTRVNQDPAIGVTSSAILAGVFQGLAVSSDQGCSWHFALTQPVTDVTVLRNDPHSALALSSSYLGVNDAGENTFSTQVYVTHDDGTSWAPLGGPLESDVLVETIDVAPGDPNTIYVGGARSRPGADGSLARTGIVLASTNGGSSYTATEIALDPPYETQGSAYVTAVDPTDPRRVYVRISDSAVDRLLVSDDGAATFRTIYQGKGVLAGFAMSSDGSKVFVGDTATGVLLADTPPADAGAPFVFAKRSSTAVGCMAWSAGKLYACTGQPWAPSLKEVAVSADDGQTFASDFVFGCVSGPLACPTGAIAATCGAGLTTLQGTVGPCVDGGGLDAGTGGADASDHDAGAGGEPSPPSRISSSCGCSAGEAAGAGSLSAVVFLLAFAVRRRRA
jgi:MYXO-CTERM domain-containing protein